MKLSDERPYFLSNKEWYIVNEKTARYELTDKAPQKAKESFEAYLEDSKPKRILKKGVVYCLS